MDKNQYGVHRTHCCIKHGCKYNDKDCPVISGEIKQDYLCESCGYDGFKSIEELLNDIKITKNDILLILNDIVENDVPYWVLDDNYLNKGISGNEQQDWILSCLNKAIKIIKNGGY